MGIINMDGNLLKKLIIAGANELDGCKQEVDALNVFPVPDGDTGTNMSLTILAAAREVEALTSPNIYQVAKAASGGSLRGARGNSGVIVSQLFRGFAKGLEGKDTANGEELAAALMKASATAYKAVMKPKEGTILTVARVLAETAVREACDAPDIDTLFSAVLKSGTEILKKTTDMLPQLKTAGVVDAGGMGLLIFLTSAYQSLYKTEENLTVSGTGSPRKTAEAILSPAAAAEVDIRFGYCTEFFVHLASGGPDAEQKEAALKQYLDKVGDSIVVVSDEDIIKVHVHTNHPGEVLERALKIGSLDSIKIENMKLQHTSLINFSETAEETANQDEWKEAGFVTVLSGDGLARLFESLGVDEIIEGGQTMNPSTEDILASARKVPADTVFVLPNNKNIILAAQQAAALCQDKKILLVPSKTVPQGLTAILNYIPDKTPEENQQQMEEAMKLVTTGQLTYAVRDTVVSDQEIKEGDILGLLEGEIVHVSKDVAEGAKILVDKLIEETGGEIVSLYYGQDVTEDAAKVLRDYVVENYPLCEVEMHRGGQPLYYYIISVE